MLKSMDLSQCAALAELLTTAEVSGSFPTQAKLSQIAMLPKNEQAERPIALTSYLYRLWGKLRFPRYREWLTAYIPSAPWDNALPGMSCADAFFARGARFEAAKVRSAHAATVLLDLRCFYELVDHTRLCEAAERLGFPPAILWPALQLYRGWRYLVADGVVSMPIAATRGILPGCCFALGLAKLATHDAMKSTHDMEGVQACTSFVDDLSADVSRGTAVGTATLGLTVFRRLAASLEAEGLQVSVAKTAILASNAKVVRWRVNKAQADQSTE
jgi:hypothetical protein